MKTFIGTVLHRLFELTRPIHRARAKGRQAINLCRNPFSSLFSIIRRRGELRLISFFPDYLYARKVHSRFFQLFNAFDYDEKISLLEEVTPRIRNDVLEAHRNERNVGEALLTGRSAPLFRLVNTYRTVSYMRYMELAEIIARSEPDARASNEALLSIEYLLGRDWNEGNRGQIFEFWRAHHELAASTFQHVKHLATPILELVTTRLFLEELEASLPVSKRDPAIFHDIHGHQALEFDSLGRRFCELYRSVPI
jgi:hypothetical protein